jgi:4-diphosphocytidyl-2-C-methyl-D-erythritol kinase
VIEAVSRIAEPAPAKINLALHVRGRLPDGRHRIETLFAFCVDGDRIEGEPSQALSLECIGPFGGAIEGENLVLAAARALQEAAGVTAGAALRLTKNLPVASGIGGGSADAAAGLRLLTRLWGIDPKHASAVAPGLGADVPACLLSMTARGSGAGDALELVDAGVSGTPVLLVNPLIGLATGAVFTAWDGQDRGALGQWREGRNDLEAPARSIVPEIGDVLDWLGQQRGAEFARMSGSGATCFALFEDEAARDTAAARCPEAWWHLATHLR